ncbi:MAG TPA: 23S rRNA (adenine(2503)-C(2))-methyltransferase RlmN [Gemmatimonadales bacterium]|jgi:23S rRNA (adenine2503-C2)-methyltransferase
MLDLLSLTPEAARQTVAEWLAQRGEPTYRASQIVPRLWQRPVRSWDQASDLPAELRGALAAAFPLRRLALSARQRSADGTEKYLWDLGDGEAIESVLIPEGKRRTLCISSQVGCALGCVFCATGRMGFRRNLTAAEIAGQVREVMLLDPLLAPTNVVFMGMGEPLLNWDAVDRALTILNHADGLGIGARHITVSTVGILPGVAQLARRPEQFRLAVSLHAPTPELRHELMPIEKKYRLPDVVAALGQFRRRVTLEYVLIGGTNDALEHADRLAQLARPLGALVNLLPLHPGGAPGLTPSPRAQMLAFERRLRRRGVEAVLRRSRGLDISAACGQLRVELEARRKVRAEEHARVE